jgi:hypothetical protein
MTQWRRWLVTAAGCLLALRPAAAELKKGDTLDQSNCQEAKDLFPPEILSHYCEGKFQSPINELPKGTYSLDESFFKAAKENEGKFKIDEHGSVVEAASGKVPDYAYGPPFPTLDEKDPEIALKILWDYEYAYWSNGSSRLQSYLMWLDDKSTSPERAISLDAKTKVIEGNPHREPNPQQFSRLDKDILVEPADLHGSTTLSWRYKDPNKRDSVWAYVPALRRVRAVSPSNRSDGLFGSEMTQDDGFNGFDAKPEDFTYTFVGKRDEYMSFSPDAIEGNLKFKPGPTGQGWAMDTPPARYGFREPGFKGLPWTPLDNHLVKRPVWIVEGVPKDRYYLYGKVRLAIDRETYKVSNVVKYDWKNQPMGVFNRGIAYGTAPDGVKYVNITGGGRGGAYAENLKMRRATAADPSVRGTELWLDPKIDASEFDLDNLVRLGE